MSDVTKLLDQLGSGATTVDAVAKAFASRAWPKRAPAADELSDPEPNPEGSFAEVAGYYAMGRINDEQYRVLATAAAGAMKASAGR